MYRPSLGLLHPPLDRAVLSPKALTVVEDLRQNFIKAVLISEAHAKSISDFQSAGNEDDLIYAVVAPVMYVEIWINFLNDFAEDLRELATCDGAEFAARSWLRAFHTAFPQRGAGDGPVFAENASPLGSAPLSSWALDLGIDDRAIKRLEAIMLGLLDSLPKYSTP